MYRPIIRLNTNTCKVCKRVFKSEKALKDHLFNKRVKDNNHVLFKEEVIKKRFENAKLECPVCKQKIFKCMKTHFNNYKNKIHTSFLNKQREFFIKKFLEGNSCLDISRIKSKYTNCFSDKYINFHIIDSVGKIKYNEVSRKIFSKRRKNYWRNLSVNQRKKIMEKVRQSQWEDLNSEQRKNHPWIIAGRKASLESSRKGSKNQKHAFNLLLKKLPNFNWRYNYALDDNWHIDIACPRSRIFIEWDGRHHRIPIHGDSYLNNRKDRDKIKNKIVTENLKGIMIRVEDDGRENLDFVEKKIEEIKKLIDNSMNKSRVIQI